MGLLVVIPKIEYSETNAGNTTEILFTYLHRAAEITAINLHLIICFKISIEAFSSKHKTDIIKLSQYAIVRTRPNHM